MKPFLFRRGPGLIRFLCCVLMLLSGSLASAATVTAANSSEFQTAINNAALGDTIVLNAGITYTGTFTLRNKTTGSGWITIQSSNLASLPAAGVRVSPSHASNMPKIVSPGSNGQAIKTDDYAHHYKLIGLEIVKDSSTTELTDMIRLGYYGTSQNTIAIMPHHIVIDRCYIHGLPGLSVRRAVTLNCAEAEVINCHISEITNSAYQNAGIGGWNGAGPFKIINNYIAATGENIIFGGEKHNVPNVVSSNIEIRRNYLHKPIEWRHTAHGGANPNGQTEICNLLELKSASNVLIDGNILENNWQAEQPHFGVAVYFKVSNYDESNWVKTEHVTFRNNIIRNASGGITIQGRDYNPAPGSPQGLVNDINIENNLFHNINATFGGAGNFMYITEGPVNVTIDRNTSFHTKSAITVSQPNYLPTGFKILNNMWPHNGATVGGIHSSSGVGNITLNTYFPDAVFLKNVLMGGNSASYSSWTGNWSPATLGFPGSWTGVLANQASPGSNYAGYKVVPGSAYDNTAVDAAGAIIGRDIGCDIDAVNAATAGCISGTWASTLIAYDGFNYTGGLNGQNGGSGFGSNAWTSVSGQSSPVLATGSMTYTDGSKTLVTGGNKLQPGTTSQSTRNLASAVTTANKTLWVSFRANHTGTGTLPSNHAGISLYSGLAATGTGIFLGKPGFSGTNWGMDHSGTWVQKPGAVTTAERNAFLVYKLEFTATQCKISMWVNPKLGEVFLGTAHQTLTKAHTTNIASLRFSTGSNASGFQFDEFRFGNTFMDVAPLQ